MSSLTGVRANESERIEELSRFGQETEKTIDEILSPEIINEILANLDWPSFSCARLVSKKWRCISRLTLPLIMNRFQSTVLGSITQVDATLRGVLKNYLTPKTDELTFTTIQTWRPQWKQKWMLALQKLPPEALAQLKKGPSIPLFGLQNVFEWADVSQQVTQALAHNDPQKTTSLAASFWSVKESPLPIEDDPEGALVLFNLLPDYTILGNNFLRAIATSFLNKGKMAKALEAALLIKDSREPAGTLNSADRDGVLVRICKTQQFQEDFEGAQKTANYLGNQVVKEACLDLIQWEAASSALSELVKEGKVEEVIERARMIEEEYGGKVVDQVITILRENGDEEGLRKAEALGLKTRRNAKRE